MKRHKALQPLSREHHETLILAQLLKIGAPNYKGLPEDREGKIIYAKALFEEKILPHFFAEERMIEKLKELMLPSLDIPGEKIICDHRMLRQMFDDLSLDTSTADELDFLGNKLEEHVRIEERSFFPLVEKLTTPEWMDGLPGVLQN